MSFTQVLPSPPLNVIFHFLCHLLMMFIVPNKTYPDSPIYFVIKVQLIYSVVPLSTIQHNDPVIHMCVCVCVYSFSYTIFHHVLSQEIGQSSLLHTRTSLLIHSNIIVCYPPTPNSPSIPLPPPSPLATTSLFSMSVSLFLFCR